MLHDRRITDFPGSFSEWEVASSERAHAAAVNAAEEEALRRVHEKQKTKRKEDNKGQRRNAQREAQKRVESVERRVADIEARIAQLTEVLGDPGLYTTEEGKRRALKAGSDLDDLKRKLDIALEEWSSATEAADGAAR